MYMNLFKYENYKSYIKDRLKEMPRQGHGQMRKLALHLGVSSVQMSHVFTGDRDLNAELALEVAAYFELKPLETEYFVLLVQRERAGTYKLKEHYTKQLSVVRKEGLSTGYRIEGAKEITQEVKAEYYSNWYYSATRLAMMLDNLNSAESIAEHLKVDVHKVEQAIEFLLDYGFCEREGGELKVKDRVLYLPADSPLVTQQHINWRLKGLEKVRNLKEDELFFSGPMTLAKEDVPRIKEEIRKMISTVTSSIKGTRDEELVCLNIDWFRV